MKILIAIVLLILFGSQKAAAQQTDSTAWFCGLCGSSCDALVFQSEGTCPHCGMKLVHQTFAARAAMMDNYRKKLSVCFYLQDGVEVLDFAGPMEVFADAGFNVFTVSMKKTPLLSQGILHIMPDYSIGDAPPADILAFFGGNTSQPSHDTALLSWIRSRRSSTRYFFSVCTGAFIMGNAGILDGLT